MTAETWTTEQYREYARTGQMPKKPRTATASVPDSERWRDGIKFTIPGQPIGKPRMTQRDKWSKRPATSKYWAWAAIAKEAAGELPEPAKISSLSWTAYFEPPKSWPKKRRQEAMGELHRNKPDRDNVDKAVLDALFKSDCEIASGTIRKLWGEPARVEVVLRFQP